MESGPKVKATTEPYFTDLEGSVTITANGNVLRRGRIPSEFGFKLHPVAQRPYLIDPWETWDLPDWYDANTKLDLQVDITKPTIDPEGNNVVMVGRKWNTLFGYDDGWEDIISSCALFVLAILTGVPIGKSLIRNRRKRRATVGNNGTAPPG